MNEAQIFFKICRFLFFLVVGLGFGMMSGVFAMINVLADTAGPGTVGFNGESQSFFMISAATCLAMILNHTVWGIITFAGLDEKKYAAVAYVWAAHYLVSCLVRCNYFSGCSNIGRCKGEYFWTYSRASLEK